jgi:ureidoacrylate peracid hydrolase
LVEKAREEGALVVYTMNTTLHNHASDSASLIYYLIKDWAQGDPERIPSVTVEDTWGEEIVDELRPKEGDVVVKKNRSSGFIQTNLDLILRNRGIKTLVIVGFVSNGCVFATARDGDMLDYFIVVAKDATDTPRKDLHEPAMKLMEWRFDAYPTDQLIEIWKNKRN